MTTILFKATAKDVRAIAKRLNESEISEIPEIYYRKFGANWALKLQGDIIATVVEWCHRDYVVRTGHAPTAEELAKAFDEFDHWDLFDSMGLSKLRPSEALGLSLMMTYAHAMEVEQ